MNSKMVSIIMPAYNAEVFLPRSIASVQNQTYGNWELLIVDDGSTDRSRELVRKIAETDKRVKLLCNQHGGTARARNAAIAVAQGEYVAFIDADDAYHPYYLEYLIKAASAENADMAICAIHVGTSCDEFMSLSPEDGYSLIDADTAFARMYHGEWPLMISPWNKLYAIKLFANVRFPEGRYFEDAATTNLAISQCEKICVLKSPLYFYHITPNSSSKTKRSVELLDREWALRSHWEYFFEIGRKDLAYLAIPFYLNELIIISYKIGRSDQPEDRQIIRGWFNKTYRKYWRKTKPTPEQTESIVAFRYPRLDTLRRMVRQDGIAKAIIGIMKRRIGSIR